MTKFDANNNKTKVVSWKRGDDTGVMITTNPAINETAITLRLALGPGYGFGGPTEQLLKTVVGHHSNCTVAPQHRR